MLKWLAILWIFSVTSSFAQTFENIRTQKDEDKIIIVYDLVSIDPGSKVTVRVYSSLDDYKMPINNATGDIGPVLPGPNKRIIWQVGKAITNDYKAVLFKFESQSSAGWKVVSPTAKGMKRGKNNLIQWQGGLPGDDVTIQLLKPGFDEVQQIAQVKNTGTYKWNTPRLKPGNGYVLRINSLDNSIEHRFSIKRRVPLGYYCIPFIGAAVYLVIMNSDPDSDELPDAPLPN